MKVPYFEHNVFRTTFRIPEGICQHLQADALFRRMNRQGGRSVPEWTREREWGAELRSGGRKARRAVRKRGVLSGSVRHEWRSAFHESISLLKCSTESSRRDASPLSLSVTRFALTARGVAQLPFSGVAAVHLRLLRWKRETCKPEHRIWPQLFSYAKCSRPRRAFPDPRG